MAKKRFFSDPAKIEQCVNWIIEHAGYESYRRETVWDAVGCCNRIYYKEKKENVTFAQRIKEAKELAFIQAHKRRPQRIKKVWEEIDNQYENGITETKIIAEFKYKKNNQGILILDENNQPIPWRQIGTAKQYTTVKSCPYQLLIWYAEKCEPKDE